MPAETQYRNATSRFSGTKGENMPEEKPSERPATAKRQPRIDKLLRYGMINLRGLSWQRAREVIPKGVKLDDIMLGVVLLIFPFADRRKGWAEDLDQRGHVLIKRKSIGEAPLVKDGDKYYYWVYRRCYALIGQDELAKARNIIVGSARADRAAACHDATEITYGRVEARGPRDLGRTLVVDYSDGFINDEDLPWQSIGVHDQSKRISCSLYQTAREEKDSHPTVRLPRPISNESSILGPSSVTPAIPPNKLEGARDGSLGGEWDNDGFLNDPTDQGLLRSVLNQPSSMPNTTTAYDFDPSKPIDNSQQWNPAGPSRNPMLYPTTEYDFDSLQSIINAQQWNSAVPFHDSHVSNYTFSSPPLVSGSSQGGSGLISSASPQLSPWTTAHSDGRPPQQTLCTGYPTMTGFGLPSAPQQPSGTTVYNNELTPQQTSCTDYPTMTGSGFPSAPQQPLVWTTAHNNEQPRPVFHTEDPTTTGFGFALAPQQPSWATAQNIERPSQQILYNEYPTTTDFCLPSAPTDGGEFGPFQQQDNQSIQVAGYADQYNGDFMRTPWTAPQ
ncbi:hypothetical protein H2200_007318 [Cladophialophora chaetospira]|uniref:Uncharacterized protein n=1 Tax=Cladophialophora chaetospira TaxID=386627 RepID=A0AA38X7K5_9EURO|nr:hypothetical protein H2200_007318 [Cladophialophora chaetospira]